MTTIEPSDLPSMLRHTARTVRGFLINDQYSAITQAADHIDSLRAELLRLRDNCAEVDIESIDRVLDGKQ